MSVAITFESFTKDYLQKNKKFFRAVDQLNLVIQKGEFFGLLGPNGAGKTTTIHALVGLNQISGGTIQVFDYDSVKDYQKTRRLIGLAPQEYNYDPFLKIHEILTYQARYYGVPLKKAVQKTRELLELFGLKDKADLEDKYLSGGMKRRLNVARALVHDPEIIILDEPTAGLDYESRLFLWDQLKKLNQAGKTIILTTHYLEEAQNLCDRIGILHQGRMLRLGSKQEIIKDKSLEALFLELTTNHGK